MILTKHFIISRNLAENIITPFNEHNVNPASYDLTLGQYYRKPAGRKWSEPLELPEEGLKFYPGQVYLFHSEEYIKIPVDLVGKLWLKSTAARQCLEQLHACLIDPGFQGQLTFEIENRWADKRYIRKGMKIMQITLETTMGTADYGQSNCHYQYQEGATPDYENKTYPV